MAKFPDIFKIQLKDHQHDIYNLREAKGTYLAKARGNAPEGDLKCLGSL